MKLRNRELYFMPGGEWGSDVRQAHPFTTLSEIADTIQIYRLRNIEFALLPPGLDSKPHRRIQHQRRRPAFLWLL